MSSENILQKYFTQTKINIIHHQQTHIKGNTKGYSLGKKKENGPRWKFPDARRNEEHKNDKHQHGLYKIIKIIFEGFKIYRN